ncbi:MAG: hypothetical protein ACJASM_000893 [Salibacteraceae bacterium]|jgi:hypothetical protein
MEKAFLIFAFMFMAWGSKEQGSPIVYDPTNGVQLIKILDTMKKVRELNEEWKATSDFIKKVVDEGKQVKRLYSLLGSMVCATDDLTLALSIEGAVKFCEEELELEITLGNLDVISSEMKMLLQGGLVLTQFETIQSLKDLNDQLEETIRETNSLNAFFRAKFMNDVESEYDAKYGVEDVSWTQDINI